MNEKINIKKKHCKSSDVLSSRHQTVMADGCDWWPTLSGVEGEEGRRGESE